MTKRIWISDTYTTDDVLFCDTSGCSLQYETTTFTLATVALDDNGEVCCPECGNSLDEDASWRDDGHSDYDDRMDERRQMGLSNF